MSEICMLTRERTLAPCIVVLLLAGSSACTMTAELGQQRGQSDSGADPRDANGDPGDMDSGTPDAPVEEDVPMPDEGMPKDAPDPLMDAPPMFPEGGPDSDAGPDAGPDQEECGNGLDDDGDGRVDNNCFCTAGETQPCYTGSHATRGVGICSDGMQECNVDSDGEVGTWGPCMNDTTPATEKCGNEKDEDCDGAENEDCTCDFAGRSRRCATRFFGRDPCESGVQFCTRDGDWTRCLDAVGPEPEQCDDDIDNDCDGEVNEQCECDPSPEKCDDDIDNDCDGRTDEPACIHYSGCPSIPGTGFFCQDGGFGFL